MQQCSQCGAENVDEARFCEACGVDLSSTSQPESSRTEPGTGSLRDEISFLTGAVEKAKARLEEWRQKEERKKVEQTRQEEAEKQETKQKATFLRMIEKVGSIVVGIIALAAFLYMLIRLPKTGNLNPNLYWLLLEQLPQSNPCGELKKQRKAPLN